jgi:DNA-binding NtrC family response regulator
MKGMTDKPAPLLIVDDEPDVLESFSLIFEANGFDVVRASSGQEAIELFSDRPVPVVVCDNSLPDAQGVELLQEFRSVLPETQVIIVTGKGTVDIAVSAMKAGVFDFITKPVDQGHLVQLVRRATQLYKAMSDKRALLEEVQRFSDDEYIGKDPSVKKLLLLVNNVARTDSTILIEGESGTGKELVARLVHKRSPRASGPFTAVDCGAIPEGLVESELFGHEKGAFTGAVATRPGKFERADGGTLFLDEITNLPLLSQAKLLRALQERTIERVGGQRQIPVNIRLIAASNIPLKKALEDKTFREDLFYRLNIVTIHVPALRDRKGDIFFLAQHFVEKHRERVKSPAAGVSREALKVMMDYPWPGNIRELENAIEHALIMCKETMIMPQHLPELDVPASRGSRLDETEREMIVQAIRDAGGNKARAAKTLNIPRSSLYSKLRKFNITEE